MAVAHERSEWDRAAAIIQKLHNVNCAEERHRIIDSRILNPYREQPKRERLSIKQIRKATGG